MYTLDQEFPTGSLGATSSSPPASDGVKGGSKEMQINLKTVIKGIKLVKISMKLNPNILPCLAQVQ